MCAMTTGEQYFLVIVEEKSISRAAEKLLLSPQNLSNYLGRLEVKYGTLFIRRPRFELTSRGIALYKTLQQIKALEISLEKELDDIQAEEFAHLRMGIHPARARSYLPFILSIYHEKYPNVKLDFVYPSSVECEKMLLHGELDILLSSDENPLPNLEYIRLCKEPVFLIVSQEVLTKKGIDVSLKGKFPMEQLSKLNFLLSPAESHFGRKIAMFLEEQHVWVHRLYTISDFELQLTLAAQGIGACFCPQMSLHKVHEINRTLAAQYMLRIFPIEEFCADYSVSLALNKLSYKSKALKGLIQVFEEGIPEYYKQCAFMPD